MNLCIAVNKVMHIKFVFLATRSRKTIVRSHVEEYLQNCIKKVCIIVNPIQNLNLMLQTCICLWSVLPQNHLFLVGNMQQWIIMWMLNQELNSLHRMLMTNQQILIEIIKILVY